MTTYQAEKLKQYIEARLVAHDHKDTEHDLNHQYAIETWEDFLRSIVNDK